MKTPSSFHIRPAQDADLPSVIRIVTQAFAVESFLEGDRIDAQRLEGMKDKGQFLVAEDEPGHVLAAVFVELRGERGYFGMLAVDPAQQGRGLGRVMVEAAEAHCRERGCKHMDIIVLSLRPDLPPLYRKLGYVEVGTEEFRPSRKLRPGYVCHGVLMAKPL